MIKAMAACSSQETFSKGENAQVSVAYGMFAISALAVWHLVADGAFSSILTLSVMIQCLALAFLAMQVISTGSAAGISAQALMLDALALCCRLSSTLWLNGYLPVDASGDHLFQIIDITSLCILAWLLYQVMIVRRPTYQAEEDSLPTMPMTVGAFLCAAMLHANMNGRPIFDTLWMSGLFVSVIAVLPQLWLITRTGGKVEALTSHYIAAMAASRALSGTFMWHAREDITCISWVAGFNHAIWAILGAHLLHLILLGDFGYYYVKAVATKGLSSCIEIDVESCGV